MEKKASSLKSSNKVGVFGGAFNPIHIGHLFIAFESMHLFNLGKVIFVPTGNPNPAFKKDDLLDGEIRLRLCQLATKNTEHFEVSDYEVKKDTPSYYIETLTFLKQTYKEIYTIIGEDAFQQIHRWKDYEHIFSGTKFIVAERYDDNFKSSTIYIEKHLAKYSEKIYFLSHPFFRVSSSMIRERIRTGEPVDFLVPERVLKIIKQKKYYTDSSSG